ncbi:hypothetical protein MXB_4455, partial [Myxobolus squamalis]
GLHLHFTVTSGLEESVGKILTGKNDNKNAYMYIGHDWSVYVLKCETVPSANSSSLMSEEERSCAALAVLRPNLQDALLWARFEVKLLKQQNIRETTDDKNWNIGKQISCGLDHIDGEPDHITQINLKQPFLITSFFLGTTSHIAVKKQPFLLPLLIHKTGVLIINKVCEKMLVENDISVYDLEPISLTFDRLKCDTKLYVGNESYSHYDLILDVISYSKDDSDGKFMYHDMCMDTDIRRNCATWYNASPIYITGKYVHRFSYEILNLDIKLHYFLRMYLNFLSKKTFDSSAILTIERLFFLDYDILKNKVISPFLTSYGLNYFMVIPKWQSSLNKSVAIDYKTLTISVRSMKPMQLPFKICVLEEPTGVYEFEDMEISSDKMGFYFKQEIKDDSIPQKNGMFLAAFFSVSCLIYYT